MFVGIAALGLTPGILGGAGLHADVKFTHDSPGRDDYFYDDVTVEQAEITFGDLVFERRSAWLSIDLALVLAVRRDFALYTGGGYSRERRYRQYFDPTITRGFEGFYWVLDEAESGNRVNALGRSCSALGATSCFTWVRKPDHWERTRGSRSRSPSDRNGYRAPMFEPYRRSQCWLPTWNPIGSDAPESNGAKHS